MHTGTMATIMPNGDDGHPLLGAPTTARRLQSSPVIAMRRRVLDLARCLMLALNRVARAAHLVPRGVLLIPPAAPGSLGDEAMVVATCEAIRARVPVPLGVVRYRSDADFPVRADRTLDLSRYFAQGGARGEELRFLCALLRYRSVALLGADVLDGYYSDDAVRLRLRLVELSARAGARTSVLGFSFNAAPSTKAREMIRALPGSVCMFARDSCSLQRLSAVTRGQPERVADTAFLLTPDNDDPRAEALALWAEAIHARGGRVLGVNLSAVAMSAASLSVEATLAVARDALKRVLEMRPQTGLMLIPHDSRGNTSDVALLRQLAQMLASDITGIKLLVSPLSARFVKRACACTDVVWTGRMHLAIAALGQGVPVVAHEYQDKFSGLFSDFGLDELVWPPQRTPTPAGIADLLVATLDRADELRHRVAARLPVQRALAQRNIDAVQS